MQSSEPEASEEAAAAPSEARPAKRKRKVVKPLSKEALETFQESLDNRGVIYLSRVPPYMKPSALRQQLSGYGTEVLRIYLQPEDTAVRARRVRSGGNKKKCFSEGWVEFKHKRRAKRIAETLNNTPMGGGHRSFYAHDLWNIKYLHKFKWHHLSEQTADAARVKQDKMRSELSQAKRETNFYMQKVGEARGIEAMSQKRARRARVADVADAADAADVPAAQGAAAASKRKLGSDGAAGRTGAMGTVAGAAAGAAAEALQAVRRSFKQRKLAKESRVEGRIASELLLPKALKTKRL